MSALSSVKVTKISPAIYKRQPKSTLHYGKGPSRFGNCFAAFKNDTLCYLTFFDTEPPTEHLKKTWSNSVFVEDDALVSGKLGGLFDGTNSCEVCLKGTDFQIEVWEALLDIEKGATLSYEGLAKAMGRPKATRAVAKAVATNNIAYFVPCHRVISKDGSLHKYASGTHRKFKMLTEEGAAFKH